MKKPKVENPIHDRMIDVWIEDLSKAGYTYDQMILIFRNAKQKLTIINEKHALDWHKE